MAPSKTPHTSAALSTSAMISLLAIVPSGAFESLIDLTLDSTSRSSNSMAQLTPEQRARFARKAVAARWCKYRERQLHNPEDAAGLDAGSVS